jgi:catechol 2,3-dioxygenase-like lactoylglutathione lyase family enzyme
LITHEIFSKLSKKKFFGQRHSRSLLEVHMIKTKGVLHVTIPVSDLARSRSFYTDVLGLQFVAEAPKENPHFVFLKSGNDYVLLGLDAGRGRFSDIIHYAFMVDGDAYDAAVAELKARGVDVFREEKRDQGVFTGRSAYFHDPDNNALEIIHLTNRAKG